MEQSHGIPNKRVFRPFLERHCNCCWNSGPGFQFWKLPSAFSHEDLKYPRFSAVCWSALLLALLMDYI
jgi:hypothetical protein